MKTLLATICLLAVTLAASPLWAGTSAAAADLTEPQVGLNTNPANPCAPAPGVGPTWPIPCGDTKTIYNNNSTSAVVVTVFVEDHCGSAFGSTVSVVDENKEKKQFDLPAGGGTMTVDVPAKSQIEVYCRKAQQDGKGCSAGLMSVEQKR